MCYMNVNIFLQDILVAFFCALPFVFWGGGGEEGNVKTVDSLIGF